MKEPKEPAIKKCATCDGNGTILLDCEEPQCLEGGKATVAAHTIECPCCEGAGEL